MEISFFAHYLSGARNRDTAPMSSIVIAAFYKFTPMGDIAAHQAMLRRTLGKTDVRGTVLLAREGINGTIAGSREGVERAFIQLRALPGLGDLEHKRSHAKQNPFYRLKVRLKKEIVSLGEPGVDPDQAVGRYVEPEDWNALIQSGDVVVIDTRNDYEVSIGAFDGAINPKTKSFRDFPEWFRNFRKTAPDAKFALYCTGGIRCEKATSLLKREGVEDVYHLKGGILKYLERIPEPESLWHGECFVFDYRVSVKHGLEPGGYDMCHACRRPISEQDKASPHFMQGVACPYCHHETSAQQRARFAQRQKQIELARRRGLRHIGVAREVDSNEELA